MTQSDEAKSSLILDQLERSAEIIFGLIMALTFTCSVSVASSEPDVRTMLVSALGCNTAWGLIDGAMYILGQLVTRQKQRNFAIAIADASPSEARRMVLDQLPNGLEQRLTTDDVDRLVQGVRALPPPSQSLVPRRDDLRGAARIFLLVFLSTLPVAIPFLLFSNVSTALRTSNAIAVALLYLVGVRLGQDMEWPSPLAVGFCVALFGAILVAIAIALGG